MSILWYMGIYYKRIDIPKFLKIKLYFESLQIFYGLI